MQNLVLGVVGDTSLHKNWTCGANPEFDLFLVYYGDIGERYRRDATYYDLAKGTKFWIVDEICKKHKEVFDVYDAILIPDDDIYVNAAGINKFFSIFHKYDLWVAQPAIIGWMSLMTAAPMISALLHYVNCVEIMTPCFTKEAFAKCKGSFAENRTNWGIDWIWYKLMGNPNDKFAVIDDVVAVHTRPCFFGDTYHRNNNSFEIAVQEIREVEQKYSISINDRIFGGIEDNIIGIVPRDAREWLDRPSERRVFPPSVLIEDLCSHIRNRNILL